MPVTVPDRLTKVPGVVVHDLYDQHTLQIMRMVLAQDSNCVDVGAHVGSLPAQMKEICPSGQHIAFEPILALYRKLVHDFPTCEVHNLALGNEDRQTTFMHVINDPAYSGLRRGRYDRQDAVVEEIAVQVTTLGKVVRVRRIDFLKIDVEGGELPVLEGARHLIESCGPTIVFESGMGASEFYGTTSGKLFDFVSGVCGLEIYTLDGFILGHAPLERQELVDVFAATLRYYFVASPPREKAERERMAVDYLMARDLRLLEFERAALTIPHPRIVSWGPTGAARGKIPNRQSGGEMGVWIKMKDSIGVGKLDLILGEKRLATYISNAQLITAGVPAAYLVQASERSRVSDQWR